MKRILFTHSYFLRFDPKQWQTGQPYAPLGTLYAAAVLREKGYSVSLFDAMFAQGPEELLPVLDAQSPDILVIYDDGFNYLTKMCLTNMREAAFVMMAEAKKRHCTVIVSSSDATDHYETYLQKGADFVILGEAEETLTELTDALHQQQTDFLSIPGLAFLLQNSVVKTAKRPVLRDLDALPPPAWDLVDFTLYKQAWQKSSGYFSINITTTRGCPFKCNWCAKPIYGNRYNVRSPQKVVEEIKWLQQHIGFDHIWFCDDIFGLKPGWVKNFADLLETSATKIRFKIQARVDLMSEEDYIQDLARAGCDQVWMGAESGSQKILDAMDKGTTVEQIYLSAQKLRAHKIKPCFFIQFGYPGETMEDIKKTIRMIGDLLPDQIGVSVSYPLPGTVFFENVKNQLQEKTNWTDSDELALMFHNTYAPAFYKQLHRYVHHEFRKRQGQYLLRQLIKNPFAHGYKDWKKAIATGWYAWRSFTGRLKLQRHAPA
jgi:anaerobic magnesium-protoporphyrin IX monomethyl ester cyclase